MNGDNNETVALRVIFGGLRNRSLLQSFNWPRYFPLSLAGVLDLEGR